MKNSAHPFTLHNQNDEEITLDALKGKWTVLYFYPKDNTPGCTTEACDFARLHTEFTKLNAQVIGISPDSTASHRTFIADQSLPFHLLSDPEKSVLKKYGAWGEKKNYGKVYEGVIRSTFLIDPEGTIKAKWINIKAQGHAEKVWHQLKELQHES